MDLILIKQKLAQLEKKDSGASKNVWRPEVGKTIIRIIPYIHNKEWPFTELFFYYKLKKGTVLSPKSFDRPDPVWEFSQELKQTGDREDWNAGVQIEPKGRFYVPILIRGRETEGVKFWGFGKTIYQELLKLMDDPDYGDITDPKVGRDLTIEVTKTDKAYPDVAIRPKPDKSELSKSKEVLELIKETPRIETLWNEPSYEDLKKLLANYLANESEQEGATEQSSNTVDDFKSALDDDSDIPEMPVKANQQKKNPPVKTSASKDEFDDLFN